MTQENAESASSPKKNMSPTVIIVLIVVALFAGVLLAKARSGTVTASTTGAIGSGAGATTITSTHNDAVADYEAALKAGKPIYVLFHSLS